MPARSEAVAGWAVTTMEVLHPDGSPVTPPAELARHDPATLHLRLRHAAPATAALRLRLGLRAAGGVEVHTVQEVALEPLHGCIRLNGGQGDAELVRWHAVLHPPVDATLDRPFALAALALLLGLALCTLSLPAFTVLAAAARYALHRLASPGRLLVASLVFEVEDCLHDPAPAASPGPADVADKSVSRKERFQLVKLRALLRDLTELGSGVAPAVYEKHVLCEYRLVRFLRVRGTVGAAAEMARAALRWRTEFGADTILEDFTPEPWVLQYFGAPAWLSCLEKQEDRLGCYLRDSEGHLTVCYRGGYVDWKKAWAAVHEDMDYAIRVAVWTLELLWADMEKLHEQTSGEVPSRLTVVYDLEGFEWDRQVPLATLLAVARRFFPILSQNYPWFLHRFLVVRAPWMFASVWAVIKPLIPKEMLRRITVAGPGAKVAQELAPAVPPAQLPKFLGGSLVGPGNDGSCSHQVGPIGPFLPDEGRALFSQGRAQPPPGAPRKRAPSPPRTASPRDKSPSRAKSPSPTKSRGPPSPRHSAAKRASPR